MVPTFLLQLGVSAGFIVLMVVLAAVAKIPRATPSLDDAALRRLLADDFPEQVPDRTWIAGDGQAGLAAAGKTALVAFRLGDGYVTRDLPWSDLIRAHRTPEGIQLLFNGPGGGLARLAWPGEAPWPPERP